jgi:acyl carrier protein
MTRAEILNKIQKIFRETFYDETIIINNKTNADDIEEWDSFNHINLVSAIEDAFSIRFALGELQDLQNVGDMIELMITNKLS